MGRLFSVPIVQKEEIPRTIGKKHTSPYSSGTHRDVKLDLNSWGKTHKPL